MSIFIGQSVTLVSHVGGAFQFLDAMEVSPWNSLPYTVATIAVGMLAFLFEHRPDLIGEGNFWMEGPVALLNIGLLGCAFHKLYGKMQDKVLAKSLVFGILGVAVVLKATDYPGLPKDDFADRLAQHNTLKYIIYHNLFGFFLVHVPLYIMQTSAQGKDSSAKKSI